MRYTSQDRLRTGAGLVAHHHNHLPALCDIAALRPIRARLATYDYWQLNEHRRRFQDIGTAPFLRLAQLIRAKMADADVVSTADVGPGVVTGDARVSFAIEAGRPQTRTLYHWRYPEHDRSRLAVGTYLGVTLIGLRVGQAMTLLDSEDVGGRVQVLAVEEPGDLYADLND
ncbi:hypothetical protein [Paracoccus benzoatiresistens]|uniref:Transcription elongation factor GreA/GreB C-terminal domain-containing protein n=1 Tax=Paracoccus benzoatiresistens TaxID=2997341 RepID=A0ABT4JB90_9RHOB|nr:hypothetical protein [Paracoccus sp. EF6]MCZ0964402.1 hypothetical protein [Paracoccus sp. EF6]